MLRGNWESLKGNTHEFPCKTRLAYRFSSFGHEPVLRLMRVLQVSFVYENNVLINVYAKLHRGKRKGDYGIPPHSDFGAESNALSCPFCSWYAAFVWNWIGNVILQPTLSIGSLTTRSDIGPCPALRIKISVVRARNIGIHSPLELSNLAPR